jgi:prepilin-type N-terminal cleavage/methylation domain-containing protein
MVHTRRRPATARRPSAGPSAGFTLLELLIVSGVLAVLFGLGVGYLGKTNPHAVADAILQGETRSAQLTARSEGLPTEVIVRPGQEGMPATVQSRLLQPVATFHFEPREGFLDDSLRPLLAGDDVPNGRFGHARRNRPGERSPVLRLPMPPARFDLREGFAMRIELWLEERGQATVLRIGQALELGLDARSRPHARLRMRGDNPVASVESEIALPLRRWCTLDVAADGRSLWLTLDGRELDRRAADGQPLQDRDDAFEVSPGDLPVPGIVDEVRLFAYTFGPAQDLPTELQPARMYRLGFDGDGTPLTAPKVEFLLPEERP